MESVDYVIAGLACIMLLLGIVWLAARTAGRAWFGEKFRFIQRVQNSHKESD